MDDDEDWEELDENAMEECMVLATQLCSQQPPHRAAAAAASAAASSSCTRDQNSTQYPKVQPSRNDSEADNGRQPGLLNNGNLGNVNDSGVWSTKSNSVNPSAFSSANNLQPSVVSSARNSLHQSATSTSSISECQKKELPQNSYRSRFSDFSSIKSTSSLRGSLSRRPSCLGKGQVPVVTSSRSSPSKLRSPAKSWPRSDANEEKTHLLLKKAAEEEKAKFEERILVMQGEISLLRSELKRKESASEAERLDHCAAIEAAEKRGREKVARQAAETDTRLREKGVLLDRLEGELHFKKREVEELLNHCRQLEQQPDLTRTPGSGHKRPRIERTATDSGILSRFDFDTRARPKLCSVEVQTELMECQSVQRSRLEIALPRGRKCYVRRIAALLSSCSLAPSPQVSSSTHVPALAACCGLDGWSLPSEWLTLVSQELRERDEAVEQKLVTLATERLQQAYVCVSTSETAQSRVVHSPSTLTEWYEGQVGPAIHILSHINPSLKANTLQAVAANLPPLYVKDNMVNRRIRPKLLEAAERISKSIKFHIEKTHCEAIVASLRECCGSIDEGSEARALLSVTAALAHHCYLCLASGVCLVGQLCKKVKKLCVPELATLRVLLDLTWAVVKIAPASACLTSACSCSSQLLGTFLWYIYQVLESPHLSGKKKKAYCVLVSCIQVLHHWSAVDPDWWEKAAPFPQYPALMATIATSAKDINFDRETVDLLCDLYEFEDGTFEK